MINRLVWDLPAGRINLTLTSDVEQTIALRLPASITVTGIEVLSGSGQVSETPKAGSLLLPKGESVEVEIHITTDSESK